MIKRGREERETEKLCAGDEKRKCGKRENEPKRKEKRKKVRERRSGIHLKSALSPLFKTSLRLTVNPQPHTHTHSTVANTQFYTFVPT